MALLAAAGLSACSSGEAPKDTTAIAQDTRVLEDAQAAVNVVIRAAPDCEAMASAKEEAQQKLQDAAQRVQTAAGRQTLEMLQKQLGAALGACE